METQIQDGYYIWEPPGKAVKVHLHVEMIDRLLAEAMRGFGAVRKRGVEVGGLLIGTITESLPVPVSLNSEMDGAATGAPKATTIVRIDDFELVPCDYRRGPSYLFGDDDYQGFENAYQRWSPSLASDLYAVGYFRSHTRDGLSLSADDIDLMDDCFPDPGHVALLIKPTGTKVSTAGFFFRENGAFQSITPLEFPFRRRELSGEEPPPHRGLMDRRRSSFENLAVATGAEPAGTSLTPGTTHGLNQGLSHALNHGLNHELPAGIPPPGMAPLSRPGGLAMQRTADPMEVEYPFPTQHPPLPPTLRTGWVWMPLSFIFLLLGLMLGFQIATRMSDISSNSANQDYSLALSVLKNGDNLVVRWNPDAPLVRASDRGELEIEDQGLTKPVQLDRANLQNGSITVQRASASVHFRLTVYPHGRVAVSETADWKQ